jgi:tRNA-2-methylthio-N6-dimethylallyladenosine synthase
MRYHIWTIGCQMNQADARYLAAQLERLGGQPVARAEDADLVILNTCVVRQQAEDRIYGRLSRVAALKRERPERRVAVMGCLVGLGDASALRERFAFVDVFMPPSDPSPLVAFLRGEEAAQGRLDEERDRLFREVLQAEDFHLPASSAGAVTAHVPIVLGCSHACTYCIIPYRRGREHSRPPGEILDEVRQLAAQGVREVILLGQIVDRYGVDRHPPYRLAGLLRDVAAVDGLARVRFLTSHPSCLDDEIVEAVATTPKVCPHFEMPIQSGDDDILARMRRGYTVAEYARRVDFIRARIPGAAIHTDIIVGFPGETEAQFEGSLRVVESLRLDKAHVAKYSVRPQTWAARHLADDVPPDVKEERRARLDERQTEILAEKHAALAGTEVEVLVDGRDEKRGRWRGRTPRDEIVFFEGPGGDAAMPGRLVRVRIEWTGAHSLIGRAAPGGSAAGEPAPEGVSQERVDFAGRRRQDRQP